MDEPSHILVVDDEQAMRDALRDTLEDGGYAVYEAPDGLAALEILRASRYPLVVLLDLVMPRLDGAGVLGRVINNHELASRHRYILLTGEHPTISASLQTVLAELDVPILRKPPELAALLTTVNQACGRLGL